MSELWDYGDGFHGRLEPPSTEDVTIVCIDCGASFVFTAGERAFYLSRGFTLPFRCRPCRLVRRAAREREVS